MAQPGSKSAPAPQQRRKKATIGTATSEDEAWQEKSKTLVEIRGGRRDRRPRRRLKSAKIERERERGLERGCHVRWIVGPIIASGRKRGGTVAVCFAIRMSLVGSRRPSDGSGHPSFSPLDEWAPRPVEKCDVGLLRQGK